MAKKGLSKGQKILTAVIAVIAALLIAGGVYCVVTEQNPADAAKSIFTSDESQLIGKWNSQASPGLSAYVFYDDGTYDSYLSTINFSGEYTVKGNKLTLRNPDTNKDLVYKYSITGKVLTLTLVEEDGKEADENEVVKFDKVDELNMKTLSDLIGEMKSDSEEKTEPETEKK